MPLYLLKFAWKHFTEFTFKNMLTRAPKLDSLPVAGHALILHTAFFACPSQKHMDVNVGVTNMVTYVHPQR